MKTEFTRPGEIEAASLAIIREELRQRGLAAAEENRAVVERVVHSTADFDFAETLRFTENAVARGIAALRAGADIVTDTNMARAGLSQPGLKKLGGGVFCYMAEPEIAEKARREGTTRAAASMRHAAQRHPGAVFAVGNAPTALFELTEQLEKGLRPALIIAVPVGFVNVVEAKERVWETCRRLNVPAIAALGRKGGSSVAAAVCNALLYAAAQLQDPAARGW